MTDINFNCPHCDQDFEAPVEMAGDTLSCPTCSKRIQVPVQAVNPSPPQTAVSSTAEHTPESSPKNRTVAAFCCFFLGPLGIHRFYVGKVGSGIAHVLTIGGLGIWTLIDFIRLLTGSFADKEGRPLLAW